MAGYVPAALYLFESEVEVVGLFRSVAEIIEKQHMDLFGNMPTNHKKCGDAH